MSGRLFPRWFQRGRRVKEQPSRMLTVDEYGLHHEHQASLMDVFGAVGYAEGEKRLKWDLPGHGSAYVDCGRILAKGCDHVHDHGNGKVFGRFFKRSCGRKACPTCFEGWAAMQGERATVRIASFLHGKRRVQRLVEDVKRSLATKPPSVVHQTLSLELEELIPKARRKPIHVVLSPPEGLLDDSIKGFRKGRDMSYRIGRQSGLYGGSCIFHPYRLRCAVCGARIPDYHRECPECHAAAFKWFWSPHFHAVGFGWIHHTREGFMRHGWVVKNLGIRDSVFWTFQYLLSHAGVSSVHTTTWFGRLAYNQLREVAKVGTVRERCPFCRRALQPLEWIRTDRPPPMPPVLSHDPFENEFLGEPSDWRHV